MKPFVYAAAMEKGATHLDVIVDAPIVIRTVSGPPWSPSNYDGEFMGPVTLRTAMAKSLNTVAVRLILKTGVEPVIDFMRRVGITSPIPRHVSIALGTPDLTLAEEVGAIAAFTNGGLKIPRQSSNPGTPPGRFIELVTKDDGTIVDDYRQSVPTERVMTPELAYVMLDLMEVVVARGTGRTAQALGRPVAGKTGTSTGFRDVWFVGTTTDRICGVWVGRDDFTPIGNKITGGGAALPIWLQYMQASHPATPGKNFEVPANVNAIWVPFLRGTLPARFGGSDQPPGFGIDLTPEPLVSPKTKRVRPSGTN
jgi:penicillin-binding protein 1A